MIKGNTSIVGEAELRLKLVYAGIIMLDVNTKLVQHPAITTNYFTNIWYHIEI